MIRTISSSNSSNEVSTSILFVLGEAGVEGAERAVFSSILLTLDSEDGVLGGDLGADRLKSVTPYFSAIS